MTPASTDEIYDRYLKKAITEINELGDEIAHAAADAAPVLGSGHPLADVFLLKYEPRPSELQEGVAFYGRAGDALLKSLKRLGVDPMAVYGTNCLKLAGQDDGDARPWLLRELHIVQFPLSSPLEVLPGELQRFTPSVQALLVPDIDESLDEQSAKSAFWNSFKTVGTWWAELPPY